MGKRLAVLSMSITLVALVTGIIGPAWKASGDSGMRRTFRVEAASTEQSFLDFGTAGTSLGDQIRFTTRLLKGGTEIGHQAVFARLPQCSVTRRNVWRPIP
jgi:hypothetical protein